MRIRVNIWMCVATIAGCAAMIYYGRRLRESGDSLQQRGLQQQFAAEQKGREEAAAKQNVKSKTKLSQTENKLKLFPDTQ